MTLKANSISDIQIYKLQEYQTVPYLKYKDNNNKINLNWFVAHPPPTSDSGGGLCLPHKLFVDN